tara:strand:- start:9078 stop:9776 length:699 start_codon:yes stop_codon:yes gene_type:complete
VADDSIYRDFYAAQDWVEAWWAVILPMLTSNTAMRVYVLSAASIVLAISILYAARLSAELRSIAAAAFVYKRRGRKPESPEAIERARQKLLNYRKEMWRNYYKLLVAFAACGFLIPSIGLYAGATFYDWFDPNSSPFVTKDGAETTANHIQLICFVLDQLSRGALQDFFEVFNVNPIEFSNNPGNYVFSAFVFLYRFVVGTFSTALMFITWQAIGIAWSMPPADKVFLSQPA